MEEPDGLQARGALSPGAGNGRGGAPRKERDTCSLQEWDRQGSEGCGGAGGQGSSVPRLAALQGGLLAGTVLP